MKVHLRSATKDFNCDVRKVIPEDAPQAREKEVDLRMYVDSDHAGGMLMMIKYHDFYEYSISAVVAYETYI